MNKRGQVTLFIILGIVLVVVLLLVTVFRGNVLETKFGTETDEVLVSGQVEPIREFVEGCIAEKGNEVINVIGKQGGDLNPGLSKYWYGDEVAYLCYSDEYGPCNNRQPFLIDHMEEQITNYIQQHLSECLDFSSWESKGYTVNAGDYEVETVIGNYDTVIVVDYPIEITRGEAVSKETRFSKGFHFPLGKLANVAKSIVDKETSQPLGQVFTMAIIALYKGEVEVVRQTHQDSEVYILNLKNDDYKFQFAVKGWVF